MRVLAVTNLYPNPLQPHRAPFNRHQFRLLAERHPVRVIAPIAWTDELRGWRLASRQVERDGLTVEHPRYWFPPRVGRRWYGHCFRLSVRRAFRQAVAEFKPDLVFAPWAYPDGWAAGRLARAAGLPVVLQVHGSDVLLLDRYPARRRRTVEAVTAADGVVAVSHDIAGKLRAMGVANRNLRVIHDGVDRGLFHPGPARPANAEPELLFVGNLVPVKAVDVLLAACGRLVAHGLLVRLTVVGGGPLRAALGRQAAALGLAGRVRFTGPVAQTELPGLYRAADLFVLPSRSEGVPNVLLEASACGVPWVASAVGGIPEIAPLGRSRLVPPGDPATLADAIRHTLADPPPPAAGPRDRADAVADLEAFLLSRLTPGRQSGGDS
jgi:glycosyltransferase involved in cell wall biosynthesis